ncbi:hypothetical protein HF086_014671 [Spodoptera exigua]|uniref:Uncharacterized protein n=1 Tax=Spodoptera exigua TaxID=7107 RepID=A0A922MLZ4_SPOEX|nr:hypothetical protein HF086_014671 [Spodoptera exigua]
MASKYSAKFSRSQNLVNLALQNDNRSAQRNDLGYENDGFIENRDGNLSSPLPFGASEIFENCGLSLLKDICFEDDLSQQEKQNDTELENSTLVESASMFISNSKFSQPHEKGTHSDSHEKENNTDLHLNCLSVQETNDYSYEPIVSNLTTVITENNSNLSGKGVFEPSVEHQSGESIQNTELLDDNDMRDIDNVTPIPSSNYRSFGEEEPIPSVPSLLSNASASSPVSQYYSSTDVSTPTRPKKRKFTKKRDSDRLREHFQNEWIDSKRKKLKNSGQAYTSRNGKLRDGKKIGEPCQSTCKLKCSEKLDESIRTTIFNKFWMIGDHSEQYNFIVNYVVRINKKRTVTQGDSRR